jgi:predicted nucleic acid-binding protein
MSVFVDTNLLIYSAIEHPDEQYKTQLAIAILRDRDYALSVQVLQEFYTQATRPSRPGRLSHAHATSYLELFMDCPVQPMTVGIFQSATAASERYRISYWDAAIVEAARALRCSILLSEDLQHDQDFDGVRVLNPFL